MNMRSLLARSIPSSPIQEILEGTFIRCAHTGVVFEALVVTTKAQPLAEAKPQPKKAAKKAAKAKVPKAKVRKAKVARAKIDQAKSLVRALAGLRGSAISAQRVEEVLNTWWTASLAVREVIRATARRLEAQRKVKLTFLKGIL